MATIKDVAKLAGYSPAAVSKYLKDPSSVRQATRDSIESAIKALHYVPSATARSLRTGRSNLYLLMVSHLRNPYFVEQFIILNDEANRRNCHLLIQTARLDEVNEWNEDVAFYTPSLQQVDGILMMVSKEDAALNSLRSMSTQVPVLAYGWPFVCPGIDTIVVDMTESIYSAAIHLLEQGHTRIGYLSDHRPRGRTADKVEGYRRALLEFGIPYRPEYVMIQGNITSAGGYNGAKELLSLPEPPTAILCENDVLATGCIKFAREHGLSVPEQLAITGQDNCYLSEMSYPQITSSSVPNRIMAAEAFDMLAARRDNPSLPTQCSVYHAQLITRESSLHTRKPE